jgi:hypothetical protein
VSVSGGLLHTFTDSIGTHVSGVPCIVEFLVYPGSYSFSVVYASLVVAITEESPISVQAVSSATGTLTFLNSCAEVSECSGNGTCTAFDTCTCDPEYSGGDCSTVAPLPAPTLAPLGMALLSGLLGLVGWRRLRA